MILSSHGLIASQIASFDADAAAFFARVTAAGGTLSNTEKSAVNQLVLDMKDDGIWNKMKAIYPMVGGGTGTTAQRQAACSQNLKSSSFTGTFTATGWTFASTGITPSSAYMDTGLNISLQTNWTSNNHISFYSRTQTPSGDGWNMGVGNASTGLPLFGLAVVRSGNNAIYDSGNFPTDRIQISQTDARGFWMGSAAALNSRIFYKNGVVAGTSSTNTVATASNDTIYLGALNNTTGSDFFMSQQCAFSSIGTALNNTEASNFYNAVQAFQTTLSRQV